MLFQNSLDFSRNPSDRDTELRIKSLNYLLALRTNENHGSIHSFVSIPSPKKCFGLEVSGVECVPSAGVLSSDSGMGVGERVGAVFCVLL